jgi:hypothetical protein
MQTGQARFGWAGSMVRSGTIRYGLSEPLVLNGSNSYEAVKAIESTDVDETCPSLLYALSHDLKCSLLTVSWEKKKKGKCKGQSKCIHRRATTLLSRRCRLIQQLIDYSVYFNTFINCLCTVHVATTTYLTTVSARCSVRQRVYGWPERSSRAERVYDKSPLCKFSRSIFIWQRTAITTGNAFFAVRLNLCRVSFIGSDTN